MLYVYSCPYFTQKWLPNALKTPQIRFNVQSLKIPTNVMAAIKFLLAVGIFTLYWCNDGIHSPTEYN